MFLVSLSVRRLFKPSFLRSTLTISILILFGGISSAVRAATIVVPAGADLQAAINTAQRGDTIIVQVASFSGGFTLPTKPGSFNGSNYITIQSANLALLPSASTRVSPANVIDMPKLVVNQPNTAVIFANSGASGYQFIGFEITNNLTGNTAGNITFAMVDLSYTANNIIFDRCVIHPKEHPTAANNWLTRGKWGFSNNASYVTIKNSFVYDFFGRDPYDSQFSNGTAQQTHAIAVSGVSDHTAIDNNFLEAWYTPILVGGSDGLPSSVQTVLPNPAPTLRSARLSSVAGLSVGMVIALDLPHSDDPAKCRNGITLPCWAVGRVSSVDASTGDVTFAQDLFNNNRDAARVVPYTVPAVPGQAVWAGTQPSDLTVTRNTFNLPFDFSTVHQATNGNHPKGFVETKSCLNCRFEGNIFGGFPGTLAVTTVNQNGGCPWCTSANITIRNNWFLAYTQMVMLSLTDYISISTQGHDIVVDNNLALNRDVADGSCVNVNGASANITITHNTCAGGFPNTYTGSSLLAGGPANGGVGGGQTPYYPVSYAPGVTIRDNLVDAGTYTAICNLPAGGTAYLNCFSNPTQDHNLFALNVPGANPLGNFPGSTNLTAPGWAGVRFTGSSSSVLTDWMVQATSPAHNAASDGTDIGANINQLSQALSFLTVPTPTPTPTPSSTPTPTPSSTPTPTATPTPTPTPTPSSSPTPTPDASPAPGPSVGSRVTVDIDGVFVRSGPSINFTVIGTASTASRGTLDQQCVYDSASPRVFCHVAFDSGVSGSLTVEHLIVLSTPTPTPSPSPNQNIAPSVNLVAPVGGSNFVIGDNVTLNANAVDSDGQVVRVDFYGNGTLLGSVASAPYSFVWTNVTSGVYDLSAKATDNSGASSMSQSVDVSVMRSPDSVNHARELANTIVGNFDWPANSYTGATNNEVPAPNASAVAGNLNSLTVEIQHAYVDFTVERNLFGASSGQIATQLMAAYYFARADAALAGQVGPSASMKAHLERTIGHLAITEDLMRYGIITPETIQLAIFVNARMNLNIGTARSGLGPVADGLVSPASLGSIFSNPVAAPLSTGTTFADLSHDNAMPFELEGVSVAVGGQSVPVFFVSPGRVEFFLPANLPAGEAEVIVVSQDGFVSQGMVNITPDVTRIMTMADDETGPALVINDAKQLMEEMPVTTEQNLSADKRTRVTFFATGISGSAANTDASNDIAVGNTTVVNLAESVVVEARTQNNQVYVLPVEFAGARGALPGLDQVNIVLVPELEGGGSVSLTLIVNGRRSNAPTIIVP